MGKGDGLMSATNRINVRYLPFLVGKKIANIHLLL